MKKTVRNVATFLLIVSLAWLGTVIADRQNLSNHLIRLHVIGASDSGEDQRVKLLVRDAVTEALCDGMDRCPNVDAAKVYLQQLLPALQELAQSVLKNAGSEDAVTVSLAREAFPTREYDTFTLPAGVYDSLKIRIGQGQGKNWWCVVFPSLCLSATAEDFCDTAAGAGFADSLTGALQQNGGYELRFFFLDCFGWLENLFYRG